MTSVLGYARTFVLKGVYRSEPLPDIHAEIRRFHEVLTDLSRLLDEEPVLQDIHEFQLLQGPFTDVITHIGQISLLRRLFWGPVPPKNLVYADISADQRRTDQPDPERPDEARPDGRGLTCFNLGNRFGRQEASSADSESGRVERVRRNRPTSTTCLELTI
jgi:hypothetical protein